jgi:dTDP-4-dehydrorhamnose reductase
METTIAMKKIYMAGCGGMLGAAFYKEFSGGYEVMASDIDLNEEWLTWCDFRDHDAYRKQVLAFRPDYLFHLGAHTDLEYCERHVDDAYMTNTIAVENAVFIANELQIPLLYISTAGIFDGRKDTYDDWDVPNPLGHYARSKHAAEVFVQAHCRKHLICRAGWMMGGGPRKDKKFVQKIMRQLREGRTDLYVVNDKLGTPTYTHDFARNVRLLLESECWGLYNMVCEGVTSRLDVAREILRILRIEDRVTIHEVSSAYFSEEYFAARPPSERLINRKLALRGMNQMQDWRAALRDYLGNAYAGYL